MRPNRAEPARDRRVVASPAMASVYDLKPRFQALLRPLVRALARAGITPNQVTVVAFLLSVAAGIGIAARPLDTRRLLLLPAVLLVRMALNAVDGMLAREHDMATPLGAFLNELGDVLADAALYLPLALIPGFPPVWVVAIVVLAGAGETAGVIGQALGASRRYDGPMGKSDRAFVFGTVGLLVGLGVPAGHWPGFVLAAMTLLLVVTIGNRCRRALAELRR